jgi:hypothetical protein
VLNNNVKLYNDLPTTTSVLPKTIDFIQAADPLSSIYSCLQNVDQVRLHNSLIARDIQPHEMNNCFSCVNGFSSYYLSVIFVVGLFVGLKAHQQLRSLRPRFDVVAF